MSYSSSSFVAFTSSLTDSSDLTCFDDGRIGTIASWLLRQQLSTYLTSLRRPVRIGFRRNRSLAPVQGYHVPSRRNPIQFSNRCSHYGTFGFNVNTWLHISLYIDFVSYLFYISLVFGMIVNQKSRAIRRSKSAAACILSLCLAFALAASMISIEMSEIVRSFSKVFVHTGKVKFYEQMINRMFYIFPVASVIIYSIYYRKKRKLAEQSALTMYPVYKSSQDNIIFNIMITSVIYGVLLIFHDVTSIFPSDDSLCFGAEYTPTVQLFNFVPELFLPISFMISTRKSWKKVGIEGSILVIRISTIAVH
ncbi:hypothetical protein GCK72_020249 [Caenorhabditis remanei]|uniref:Serpentine receptor class gamma n=1 Tax=Caenorhabditis remanei TaxID=31234 RepID=A0A6A5GGR1_CAERE|nr:hypothetical protein GCK72_020249 [Caenorhabditis remanei]KAF1753692.1 hypothetical protein GCK72_020249 [Caenorhabditis remanei]